MAQYFPLATHAHSPARAAHACDDVSRAHGTIVGESVTGLSDGRTVGETVGTLMICARNGYAGLFARLQIVWRLHVLLSAKAKSVLASYPTLAQMP